MVTTTNKKPKKSSTNIEHFDNWDIMTKNEEESLTETIGKNFLIVTQF
jgi:hypothetical protein